MIITVGFTPGSGKRLMSDTTCQITCALIVLGFTAHYLGTTSHRPEILFNFCILYHLVHNTISLNPKMLLFVSAGMKVNQVLMSDIQILSDQKVTETVKRQH
jgi:hypothetical protein